MDTKTRENVANYLLNHCFVPCDLDSTREKYYTIVNNQQEFSEIFKPIGYSLIIHPAPLRIVQLVNNHEGNQIRLKKYESIITLILRLLYIEKRECLPGKDENVKVSVEDIEQKYNTLNLPRRLDQKMLESVFKELKKYNIAFPVNKLSDASSEIIIMSTVMLALPDRKITEAYENTQAFLYKYSSDKEEIRNVEDDKIKIDQLA
ncbi:MAG: DUF4194 domain-containing protein [Oscillospiraceae bacterium]